MKLSTRLLIFDQDHEEHVLDVGHKFSMNIDGLDINIHTEIQERGECSEKLLRQTVHLSRVKESTDDYGIRLENAFLLGGEMDQPHRFFVPSLRYSEEAIDYDRTASYMDDRLPALFCGVFNETTKKFNTLSRTKAPGSADAFQRKYENRFLQKTEVGYIGYGIHNRQISILCGWPYKEEDKSVALNSKLTPVYAYFPLSCVVTDLTISLEYRFFEGESDSFTDAVYSSYRRLAKDYEASDDQKMVQLPFTLKQEMQYRMDSLKKTYREFGEDGAGFFFHFDPKHGYDADPTGFNTAFITIPETTYQHILEYGFTGREINVAWIVAKKYGGEWTERGERVINFFLRHCTTESGWVYTLYDLKKNQPFYSFGDRDSPHIHYVSDTDTKGNYLRTMVEAMNDLLEAYLYYVSIGRKHEEWLDQVLRFANFLITFQSEDGAWYRRYQPNGMRVIAGNPSLPENIEKEKCATAIVLPFFCNLIQKLNQLDHDGYRDKLGIYNRAVNKAGEYILRKIIPNELYKGGTLDNPNIVDKEAAQYVMAGMYELYCCSDQKKYLQAAYAAARQFVTWIYMWNAPQLKETILGQKHFKTKGCGAINSIWGGGVVDIYALFHIRELYLVGKSCRDDFLCEVADWMAHGTHQILSWKGDLMGFKDTGMQPEGFGICPQGIDDGQIHKGDIWGSLGWIYSAGIYGLGKYLAEKLKE